TGSSISRRRVRRAQPPRYAPRPSPHSPAGTPTPAPPPTGTAADAAPAPPPHSSPPPPPPDTTPPDTTIGSGPASSTTSTTASFSFSSTETGSSFECRLDGGAWGSCSSPKSYSGLSVGSPTFDVRAKDAAGNPHPSPASQ